MTSGAQPSDQQRTRSWRLHLGLDRFSGLYLWALFIVVFAIWSPNEFFTIATVHGVASAQAITGLVALAVLIPLAAGIYDLSVGATANLCGIVAVVMMNDHHFAVVPAVVFSLAIGLAIGLVNAFVVVGLSVNSFIATLGMGSILSATQVIVSANAQPNPPLSSAWNNFTQQSFLGGFQLVVVYLLVIAVVLWWVQAHTPLGRYLYAIGGNPEAARLSGVPVRRYTVVALAMSATISAIAGVLFTSQNGPSLAFGPTLLLPAFASAFLGSTQLTPGRFNVWGTLIAIFALATGVQGLELVSGASWLSDMFNGVTLILAVALSINRTRAVAGRQFRWIGRRRPPVADAGSGEDEKAAVTGSSQVAAGG